MEFKILLILVLVNIFISSLFDFIKLEIKGMKEENINSEVKSDIRFFMFLFKLVL